MNFDYDFCVFITTYNRPEKLNNLLNQIIQNQKNFKIKIFVFDDGSDEKYNIPNFVKHVKFYPNMGKKRYWKIIDTTFKYLKNLNSKYFIYLPDDINLSDNFFEKSKSTYESINDSKKICLSLLTDKRVKSTNWTNFKTVDMGDVLKTQWNDLCFISEKTFFSELDFKIDEIPLSRWINNPSLSSGVGSQISLKLHNKGKSMYHTKLTLVLHGNHESKMNYEERKLNNIITI